MEYPSLYQDIILFQEKINPQYILQFNTLPLETIKKRNNLIYLTFFQVFSSLFGMFFFIYRRSIVYIIINSITLLLSFFGLYGAITISVFFLLIHCVLTVSFGGGFLFFQIINDLFTDDSSYGDSKRISDHVLLWIFSLPYIYDVFTGVYNYYLLKSMSIKSEDNNEQNENFIDNLPQFEMGNINNESNSNINSNSNSNNNNDRNEKDKCIICCKRDKNVAFEPCGHVGCCDECGKKFINKECPFCRKKCLCYIKVYIE